MTSLQTKNMLAQIRKVSTFCLNFRKIPLNFQNDHTFGLLLLLKDCRGEGEGVVISEIDI